MKFNDEETGVILKLLKSNVVQLLIGAEEWDLTEAEEDILWEIIEREGLLKASTPKLIAMS